MIEKVVAQLLQVYPEVNREHLKIVRSDYDALSYEISIEGEEVPLFFVTLDETGELFSFSKEMTYGSNSKIQTREEIMKTVEHFIGVFMEEERESLHLSAIIDMNKLWWIDFVQKDPYLGLKLPLSGINIRVEKSGIVTGAILDREKFKIEEPKVLLSAEEAKILYLEKMIVTPAIMKFDTHYIDGDDKYYYVYNYEEFILSIGTDREMETIETLGIKLAKYEPFFAIQNIEEHLYEIIGMPLGFLKLSDEKLDVGRIELWGDQSVSEVEEKNLVEITFNEDGLISWLSADPIERKQSSIIQNVDIAFARTVMFLQSQYADATDRFQLMKEAHELCVYDDETGREIVDAYQFTFQRFERGVMVLGQMISVEVDSRSLMITHVHMEGEVSRDLSKLDMNCTFSTVQARQVYAKLLEMETGWRRKEDEDTVLYELAYLPEFLETVGHMRAIDAKTGRPWFIDASWIKSLDE